MRPLLERICDVLDEGYRDFSTLLVAPSGEKHHVTLRGRNILHAMDRHAWDAHDEKDTPLSLDHLSHHQTRLHHNGKTYRWAVQGEHIVADGPLEM